MLSVFGVLVPSLAGVAATGWRVAGDASTTGVAGGGVAVGAGENDVQGGPLETIVGKVAGSGTTPPQTSAGLASGGAAGTPGAAKNIVWGVGTILAGSGACAGACELVGARLAGGAADADACCTGACATGAGEGEGVVGAMLKSSVLFRRMAAQNACIDSFEMGLNSRASGATGTAGVVPHALLAGGGVQVGLLGGGVTSVLVLGCGDWSGLICVSPS